MKKNLRKQRDSEAGYSLIEGMRWAKDERQIAKKHDVVEIEDRDRKLLRRRHGVRDPG